MISVNSRKDFDTPTRLDYAMTILMLFSSNSLWWYQARSISVAIFTFLVASFLYHQKKFKRITFNGSFPYIAILIAVTLLNSLLINPNVTNYYWITVIINAFSAYLYFSAISFSVFRKVLFNVMSVLMGINILLMGLRFVGILPVYDVLSQHQILHQMFFIFNMTDIDRLSGIWHEPGACQIYINTTLLFFLPDYSQRKLSYKDKIKLFILVAALVLTRSTGGYLAFILIAFAYIWPYFIKTGYVKKVLICFLGLSLVAGILTSSVVQDKIAQKDQLGENSYVIRMNDNLACWQMSIEKPFTGYGWFTKEFQYQSMQLENRSSSNGILLIGASIGAWWYVLLFFTLVGSVRRLHLGVPFIIPLLAFLAMEANEEYMTYVFSYCFIVYFRQYRKKVVMYNK